MRINPSNCDLIYDTLIDSGKSIKWTSANSGKNTNITDEDKYYNVKVTYYVSYSRTSGTYSGSMGYRAYGTKTYGTTDGSVRWIVDKDRYAYKGKVTGELGYYTTYYWTDNNSQNLNNFDTIPKWSELPKFTCNLTNISAESSLYYIGNQIGVNGLVYNVVEDDLLMQPRGGDRDYVVWLIPDNNKVIVRGKAAKGDMMSIYWTTPKDNTHHISFTTYFTDAQWLTVEQDIRSINLKKIKDMYGLDWTMSEGLPIYKAITASTYTLEVTCPADGYLYFYNRTKNKITDWSTLYTKLNTGTENQVEADVPKTFSVEADENDWLAIVYLPTSGQHEITRMSMTKKN